MSRIFVISVVLLTFTLSFFLGCSAMGGYEKSFARSIKSLVDDPNYDINNKKAMGDLCHRISKDTVRDARKAMKRAKKKAKAAKKESLAADRKHLPEQVTMKYTKAWEAAYSELSSSRDRLFEVKYFLAICEKESRTW